MKNVYEKLFSDFLAMCDFTLARYPNGYGVIDKQGGNLADIENERFQCAIDIVDKMDRYIEDYLVTPISDALNPGEYKTYGELARRYLGRAGDLEADVRMLDAVCNHALDIRLENIDSIDRMGYTKWIYDEDSRSSYCSECHSDFEENYTVRPYSDVYRYCPHCGASMFCND